MRSKGWERARFLSDVAPVLHKNDRRRQDAMKTHQVSHSKLSKQAGGTATCSFRDAPHCSIQAASLNMPKGWMLRSRIAEGSTWEVPDPFRRPQVAKDDFNPVLRVSDRSCTAYEGARLRRKGGSSAGRPSCKPPAYICLPGLNVRQAIATRSMSMRGKLAPLTVAVSLHIP